MLKRLSIISALCAFSASVFAADYYVVVPVKNRTASEANISVALNSISLPGGFVGNPYSGADLNQALVVTGDPAYRSSAVSWSIVDGALPAGLTLNSNGTITGTPVSVGSGSFTVRATYRTKSGAQTYEVFVGQITVSLQTATMAEAIVGKPYFFDLKPKLSIAGDPAYAGAGVTWETVTSTLPAGLTLQSDGTVRGTATAAGTGNITVRATYKNAKGEQTYQIVSANVTAALALPFDGTEGSKTITDTSGQFTATVSGNAKLSTTTSISGGSSLLLDGSTGTKVSIAYSAMPRGTENFTIEGWFYPRSVPTGEGAVILSNYAWYDNTNSSLMIQWHNSRYISFAATNNTTSSAYQPQYQIGFSSPAIPLNQWTHFAIVRNGANFTMYIQGQPVVTKSHSQGAAYSINNSTRALTFGYHPAVAGGTPSHLNAYLDNIRVVRGAALYNEPFTPPTQFPQ